MMGKPSGLKFPPVRARAIRKENRDRFQTIPEKLGRQIGIYDEESAFIYNRSKRGATAIALMIRLPLGICAMKLHPFAVVVVASSH
jgi:hypothetical protein